METVLNLGNRKLNKVVPVKKIIEHCERFVSEDVQTLIALAVDASREDHDALMVLTREVFIEKIIMPLAESARGERRSRKWLDVKEAARHLNVSGQIIYRELGSGRLKGRKHGGRWVTTKEDLNEWSSLQVPE
jgi:excisionase family DNA binding protein